MGLTRRQMIRLGAAAGAAAAVGPRRLLGSVFPAMLAPAPRTRVIPSSGEPLPVVGIGTARRYDVATSAAEKAPLKQALSTFRELGGKVIDTAPSYGNAETVVGDLVQELGFRDELFLATKVRQEGHEQGLAEIEQSFEHLHADTIDLIQVHNLVDVDTQLGTLRDLKAAGRIRYVGMTTSSSRQHEAFANVMRRETLDFIQVDYSLASREAADVILPLAADRGIAVLINLPYARARLFSTVGDRPLPDWAAEFDCESWGQFFLKYILGDPAVTCVIPGTATPEYARDNMGAAFGGLPDASMRRRMEAFYDDLAGGG
jgi:aryl-alcohol dehydrogenase-like predicted oxidoreductase